MATSRTVFLLSCDKYGLKAALAAFTGEDELRAEITAALDASGEYDTDVTLTEPQIAFIRDRLAPWAASELPEQGSSERTLMAKMVLASVAVRLE